MKMYRPHRLCPRNSKPKEPSLYRSLCVSILCMFLSTVMLVGTTFAWFHSSATSAVSTITAGGLNVSTSYITQNTARAYAKSTSTTGSDGTTTTTTTTYDDIPSAAWIAFSGNGGNPFGSISVTPETPQIVFLKVENKSPSYAIYRLSLNLLRDSSSAQPESNLYYGYQVLGSSVSTESLCKFTIPGSNDSNFKPNDLLETTVTDTNYSNTTEKVTTEGPFYGDALSAHGISSTDSNTFGGNLCVVDLPVDSGSTKYIAVALYSSDNSSESTDSSSFLVQLSMTVNQFGATDPLMPNRIEQSTPAAASAKLFTMFDVEPEEETGEEEDTSEEVIPSEETPAEEPPAAETPTTNDNGTADQPTTGTQTSPETPPGSTGESGTPSGASDTGTTSTTSGTSGTSDTDTSGGTGAPVSEPQAEVPTT